MPINQRKTSNANQGVEDVRGGFLESTQFLAHAVHPRRHCCRAHGRFGRGAGVREGRREQRGTRREQEGRAHVQRRWRFRRRGEGARGGHELHFRSERTRVPFVHLTVKTARAGERGRGRDSRRLPLPDLGSTIRAYTSRGGRGARREVSAVHSFCAGVGGTVVVLAW